MNNLTKHPCENKCTEFKDEQCSTCLIQPVESIDADFIVGDAVVFKTDQDFDCTLTITLITANKIEAADKLSNIFICNHDDIRTASLQEVKKGHRLPDFAALFVSDIDVHFERAIQAQKEVNV